VNVKLSVWYYERAVSALIFLVGVGRTLALVVVEVLVIVAPRECLLAALEPISPDRGVICAVRDVFVAVCRPTEVAPGAAVRLDASADTVVLAAVLVHLVTSLLARPFPLARRYDTGDVDVCRILPHRAM